MRIGGGIVGVRWRFVINIAPESTRLIRIRSETWARLFSTFVLLGFRYEQSQQDAILETRGAGFWLLLENPNMRGRYWLVALALLSGFAGLGSPASAVLVDWSTLNWPSGSL